MLKIDAHQHFWRYDPAEYPWIRADWPIRRTFLPPDLELLLNAACFDHCVAVQARQTLAETEWLLTLAAEHRIIAGVVGWADLRSPDLAKQLERFSRDRKLVGVRHVVQDEPDDKFMLRPDFVEGIKTLGQFDLAYDVLIFPKQLPAAIQLADRFPEQRFVLDHIAKPFIKDRTVEPWRTHIRELAARENVFCKLSGMVTEANWRAWTQEDFRPYLEVVWEAFGPDRLMAGSDWPVCLLSGDYVSTMNIVIEFLRQLPEVAQEKVLGGNAIRFYRLPL